MKQIIIPSQNKKELDEIPEHVKKGITFHLVDEMVDVIEKVF
jgi:ATP-dependent Lon protease